jgi:hypothetical protein
MNYIVRHIEFDFGDDFDELTVEEKQNILDDSIGWWEADDEDDLIEEITSTTGWCVKSVDFEHMLQEI